MGFDAIVIIIIAGILVYKASELIYIKVRGGKYEKLTVAEFREFSKTHKPNIDFLLLDVRTAMEVKNGKIGGSINIPVNEVSSDELRIKQFKEKPIIIYCQSGTRSKKAASKLAKSGAKNLYFLSGGYKLWKGESGF